MNAHDLMLHTADILEKTAAYLEKTESEKVAQEKATQQKAASDLADRISDVTGEPIDGELIDKLASLTPEVQDVISRLTGGGMAESMGGPDETTKVASSGGMGSAEERFLSFLMS